MARTDTSYTHDWLAAFEALKSVYTDGAYSNMALNESIPRHRGCRDSFVRNLVKGVIRQTITLDYIIDELAAGGIRKIRPRTLIILRMGLYTIREINSVPDHAAVNAAVDLSRKTARGTDRFINAVLRSYIRRRDEFEPSGADMDPPYISEIQDDIRRLAVRYSMPDDLIRMISEQYGDQTELILRGLNDIPNVILRVNTLRITRDDLIAELTKRGIQAEPASESDLALIASGSGIVDSDLYREGYFTIQSLSSMIAVEALAPQRDSRVLDMCAAPGGKSTMMAEMMGNNGSILSCDIHEHRLRLIQASAVRTGADIISTRIMDGTVFEPSMEGQFDYVLADVPCSGLGDMGIKPEIRLRADPDSWCELTETQAAILSNAIKYTKPGGRICYSTCTLNKEENEHIVRRCLSSSADLVRIIEMNTILPYNNLIGFYYCILEKDTLTQG